MATRCFGKKEGLKEFPKVKVRSKYSFIIYTFIYFLNNKENIKIEDWKPLIKKFTQSLCDM